MEQITEIQSDSLPAINTEPAENSLPAIITDSTPETIPEPEAIQIEPARPVSIFEKETFQVHDNSEGRPWVITPKQWLFACKLFEGGKTIREACKEAGLCDHIYYYRAMRAFDELRQRHTTARIARADVWADDTIDLSDKLCEDKTANMAQVRAVENAIHSRQWVIERHNPEEYGSKTQLNVNSRNVNINANIPVSTGAPIDSILNAFKSNG